MIINVNSPIIKYSEKGKEFKYDKLFLNTFSEQIESYKNVIFDKLTTEDKSIALARVIKSLEVNGVKVTDYYASELSKWSEEENFQKNLLFIDLLAREMFGSYDKNRNLPDGKIYLSENIFAVVTDGKSDYLLPPPPSKLGLKFAKLLNKNTDDIALHEHYVKLLDMNEKGLLSKSS